VGVVKVGLEQREKFSGEVAFEYRMISLVVLPSAVRRWA
jgi:hypothetical protein